MELNEFNQNANRILETTGSIFVGEELLLRKLLAAALANGHVLFEDNPGLGKTLLAKVFAKATGCGWKRVQFTPDIMPVDILGNRIWRPQTSDFIFERGPIFTNILLADEINRSPPKTQSALLEAMEERQVTIEGTTYKLTDPYFVMATQNPIEQEGTFPLPEAQMDRFLLKLATGYVKSVDLESEILRRRIKWRSDDPVSSLPSAVTQEQFTEMQRTVENGIYVDETILTYISTVVRATRDHVAVEVGSSPRGALALLKVSRAHAAMMGRDFVTPDDVKLFAVDALSHRIILKMEYEIESNVRPEGVLAEIMSKVEVPKDFVRK
ncbi:MAG: ATPase RavA [Methanomassiliicoccales archaeon PtaU1.Bin124]|nr:MAG: ATPase RavA [Methanomassiliicoccales archaeon PtaU1.Bin124]